MRRHKIIAGGGGEYCVFFCIDRVGGRACHIDADLF